MNLNYQYYYTRMPEHYWENLEIFNIDTPDRNELKKRYKEVRQLISSKEW